MRLDLALLAWQVAKSSELLLVTRLLPQPLRGTDHSRGCKRRHRTAFVLDGGGLTGHPQGQLPNCDNRPSLVGQTGLSKRHLQ